MPKQHVRLPPTDRDTLTQNNLIYRILKLFGQRF